MTLRIACDLDGTLADMDGALRREAEAVFGPRRKASDVQGAVVRPGTGAATGAHSALTDREVQQLWNRVSGRDNFWLSLDEIEPGAVARLSALASMHRWEVIFLTQRPATSGATAQSQTQRWLESRGFELPSVYVVNGSRGKVASALELDAVLDDRPDNCLDVVAESAARAFLIWRGSSETVAANAKQIGITVVFTIAEALEQLEKLTQETKKPGGLLGRLGSALRL